jgi:hypothetical protein
MKIIVTLAVSLLIASTVWSQNKPQEKKLQFTSINQLGAIVGSNRESVLIQTINGIRKDKWSAGIGVGVDFYVERGVPLFLDIRRDLFDKDNTPFVYADAGKYYPWLNFIQREQKLNSEIHSGAYYDVGAGWKLHVKNSRAIILSAGYSFKQVKETTTQQVRIAIFPNTPPSPEYYNYKYRRLVVKLGFQL